MKADAVGPLSRDVEQGGDCYMFKASMGAFAIKRLLLGAF
jgi:hypothetical protein